MTTPAPYNAAAEASTTETERAWLCPECANEVDAGRLADELAGCPEERSYTVTLADDGERLYIHCPRHCRLLADAPLSAVRTGADRVRERAGARA